MSYTYKTGILFTLSDDVDAQEHDVFLTVHYTVYPGSEPTQEQPGEGPSVTIQKATVRSMRQTYPSCEHDAPDWLWPHLEEDKALEAELLAHAERTDEVARDQAVDARCEERRLEQ